MEKTKSNITDEIYDYNGFKLQRLIKDSIWYVIHENKIVKYSNYRNDLEEWIDTILEETDVCSDKKCKSCGCGNKK